MDTFESLNAFANRCAAFTPDELELFHSLLERKSFSKKTLLLSEGEICDFEAYVINGCLRSYFLDENGFEVVLQFSIEDWWVSDIASFHERKPSRMFIETLEDSELFLLSYENKEILLEKAPKFERLFRLMVQRNLSATQNRLINTIAKSAMDKYLEFLQLYPQIPNRVAQHHIAAYLGISAEFLSKIRKRLSHQ